MSFSALDYSCLDGIDIGGFVDGSDCSYLTSSQLCRLEFQPLLNSPDQSEPSSSRFAEPVTKQTLVQLKEATTPSGTSTRTATIANWAYSMWQEWARSRNELSETYGEVYPCVPVSLHDTIAEEFDFWLARFNLGDDMTAWRCRELKRSLSFLRSTWLTNSSAVHCFSTINTCTFCDTKW